MYRLVDAYARHAAHPDTFEIPSHAEVAHICVGDHVKLIFEGDGSRCERMWVTVTGIQEGAFQGRLANDPVFLPLAIGDLIDFKPCHVICITTNKV